MINISFSKNKDHKAIMFNKDHNTTKQIIGTRLPVSNKFKLIKIDRTKDKVSVKTVDNLIDGLNWLKES